MFNQSVAIWFKPIGIENFKARSAQTCAEWLGIEFIEVGEDFVRATMPVDHRTQQPMGILNGGASVALAESVASAAANFCVDSDKFRAVGLEINANHLRSVPAGETVTAISKPLHLGRTTHVWETRIHNHDKLVCICRMTLAIILKETLPSRALQKNS